MTRCFFGIGGGSDFNTAWLLCDPRDIIITALAPIYSRGVIDIEETIRKYTGQPYSIDGNFELTGITSYLCYSTERVAGAFPVLVDGRRPHSYGLIVPPHSHKDQFSQCCVKLQELAAGSDIVAVDTGGDSLRGLVGEMGNNDISHLFGGVRDTRDTDSICLLRRVTRESFRIYVCGPGSDGETTGASIIEALDILEHKSSGAGYELLCTGSMSEFGASFDRIPAWSHPIEGSTISNIMRALHTPSDWCRVIRRGRAVSSVPSAILSSYWVLRIRKTPS